MTVSVTFSSSGTQVKVVVLTGATEAGGAQSAFAQSSAAAPNWSLTPNGSHSLPLFVIYDQTGGSSGEYTAEPGNTLLDNSIQHDAFCDGYYSGTVTAGTPVTLGCSAPSATKQVWASYEVPSSGASTPVQDASTPAVATSTTSSVTSPAFTPPAGAVLVVLASGNNATADGTISDSSGLTWTLRSGATGGGGTSDVWTATVPGNTVISGSDTGHAAEAASVHATLAGAGTGHAAEAGSASARVVLAYHPGMTGPLPFPLDGASAAPSGPGAGADSGHGAEAGSVHAALSGADTAHGAEAGSVHVTLPGADSGHAAEAGSIRISGSDTAHGTEGSSAHAALSGSESGHGAEGFKVRVSGAESGHGSESGSVHVTLAGADTAHGADAGSVFNQSNPHGADSVLAVESAFYYHAGADTAHAAEGGSLRASGRDAAAGTDFPARAWPSSADAGSAADRPRNAWPSRGDLAHGSEAWRPFGFTGADSGHAAESFPETIGIWTYLPPSIRLGGRHVEVVATDERTGREFPVLRVYWVDRSVLEMGRKISESRAVRRITGADAAVSAEAVTRVPVAVTCWTQPAVSVQIASG